MKAILNRELPEAAREVRQVQDLILAAANEMLALTERLQDVHHHLDQDLAQAAAEYQLLGEVLDPARENLAQARSAVAQLREKMNFKDLAGQSLARVAKFCAALSEAPGRPSAERAPEKGHKKWPAAQHQAGLGAGPDLSQDRLAADQGLQLDDADPDLSGL